MPNPVLQSLKPIVEDSKFVFVNKEKIEEIAPLIAEEDLKIPTWDFPYFIEENTDKTIDFFFIANSINFAFTDFKSGVNYQVDDFRGASGMWFCLKKAYENGIPILDADYLKQVTRKELGETFKGNIEIPMLDERVMILNEVGHVLNKKYKRRFYNLYQASFNRAFDNGTGMVDRLIRDFPSFNDASEYNGHDLQFHKRAQLAVAMLYGRLDKDIDDLTVFADYVLPVGLLKLGVFEYSEDLRKKIGNRVIIEKDSLEELEIRANTIYASDLLIKEINKHRTDKINALNLDSKLWKESHTEGYVHHLTKTIAY